jgi:nucleoside-diphosphate-sugar epimerase
VSRSILVTGATGLVGRQLLPRLSAAGFEVLAVSRRPSEGAVSEATSPERGSRARWIRLDLAQGELRLEPAAYLLHTAPIWLLPRLLSPLADLGLRRLVAFSSTSRFTKWDSGTARERDLARRLSGAEEAVQEVCHERGIAWTLFRPTLIYGGGRDRNVSDTLGSSGASASSIVGEGLTATAGARGRPRRGLSCRPRQADDRPFRDARGRGGRVRKWSREGGGRRAV